eukprot:2007282-Prymnesium_polylepis.1
MRHVAAYCSRTYRYGGSASTREVAPHCGGGSPCRSHGNTGTLKRRGRACCALRALRHCTARPLPPPS